MHSWPRTRCSGSGVTLNTSNTTTSYPPTPSRKVRRLDHGLLELRVEHADGSTWILRDLEGDETPDELRALARRLAGLDENDA